MPRRRPGDHEGTMISIPCATRRKNRTKRVQNSDHARAEPRRAANEAAPPRET
jgi:hypothetical protein